MWNDLKHATSTAHIAVRSAWHEVRCVVYVLIAMIGVVHRKIHPVGEWEDTMMLIVMIFMREAVLPLISMLPVMSELSLTTIVQLMSVFSTMPVPLTNIRIGSDLFYARNVRFHHDVWFFDGSQSGYYALHSVYVWYVRSVSDVSDC